MANKLKIREDSQNYAAQIIKLPAKQEVIRLDNLVKITFQGNDCLVSKNSNPDIKYIFFPAETQLAGHILHDNNLYRDSTLNNTSTVKGFFEPSGRCKSIKFKGIISTGFVIPLEECLLSLGKKIDISSLEIGDEFTDINDINICKKYRIQHIHASTPNTESKFNKKLKRFDRLVPNQFRFHDSTAHLAKNLHQFNPDDIIVITDKWHGSSGVFSNVLIKKELTWLEKILKKLGFDILTTRYDRLYSSRTVIKNQYINKDQNGGYYGEDIWAVVNKQLEDKIEIGITLYGEIVGFTPSGKAIQKGYDYGCKNDITNWREDDTCDCNAATKCPYGKTGSALRCTKQEYPQHKFLVYRITYTKPDGNVIEFSWSQIKNYCQKYQLEHVKELYFGKPMMIKDNSKISVEQWRDDLFNILQVSYLEKDCKYCVNKVPAEGIVVRIDGQDKFSAYKLKSKRFLEFETKELDKGEISIEDEN